jgi:hypothetical protein
MQPAKNLVRDLQKDCKIRSQKDARKIPDRTEARFGMTPVGGDRFELHSCAFPNWFDWLVALCYLQEFPLLNACSCSRGEETEMRS